MTERETRITDLASAVADGAPVDWDAAMSLAADESERRQINRMRLVRQVVEAQTGSTVSASQAGSVHESILTPGGVSAGNEAAPVTWGPLRVLEKIGRGRFGDVYRAWDPRLDREVALKLLRHRPAAADDLGSSVIEEGRLLAKVRHTNVVTVYGAERIDDRVGVWMELITGKTLEAELVANGPLSSGDVVSIGIDLCRALAAVHRAGLVHRDLKAQNVMRDDEGRLVLMDFGTGRELDADSAPELAGTPLYIAPEILEGSPATAQSDLYSLGVLLYHLATGGFPVSGKTLRAIREEHARRAAGQTHVNLSGLPPQLATALAAALAPDPAHRVAEASSFEKLLSAARAAAVPARGRTNTAWVAAAAAVVVIATVAAIAMTNRGISAPSAPVERVVWSGPSVPDTAAISEDGQTLAYVDDGGRIVLRPLAGGEDRPLTAPDVWPNSLAFSRDGARLAYSADNNCCAALKMQLLVIDLSGSGQPEPRVIRDHGDGEWLDVFDWSSDGTRIAVRLERYQEDGRVGFVSLPDGELHVMATLNWRGSNRVSISPDGAWFAYDATADAETMQRDVFVASTNGGQPVGVLTGKARESVMQWAPDGQRLIVASDRDGQSGLWDVPMVAGRASGEPSLVRSSASEQFIGITKASGVFVFATISRPTLNISSVDYQTGRLVAGPTIAPVLDADAHTQTPMFSPDGKSLAFVSRRPRRDTERTIVIQSPGTSALAELPLRLSQIWTFSWSPDRRSLLARATDFEGRQGIHQIDAHTGVSTPILLNGEFQYFLPQWAGDGKSFYYTRVDPAGAVGQRNTYRKRSVETGHEEVIIAARQVRTSDGGPFPETRDWTISPDGRLIAGIGIPAASPDRGPRPGGSLWTVSVKDRVARKLLELPPGHQFTANSLHWTSDGSAIVANRQVNEPSRRELVLVAIDGRVTSLDVGAVNLQNERFALHPDRRQVAFMAGEYTTEIRVVENALGALRAPVAAVTPAAVPLPPGTPRKLLSSETFVVNDVSRDGRLAVGGEVSIATGTSDVVVRDLVTGRQTVVVRATSSAYGVAPVFSADARYIAYRWIEKQPGNEDFLPSALRIGRVAPEGEPQSVVMPDEQQVLIPVAWARAGDRLLVRIRRPRRTVELLATTSLGWVNLKDGTTTSIKAFEAWQGPMDVTLSPDAAYIAYSVSPREVTPERHLHVLNADGTRDNPVVKIAGANRWPVWTPSGDRLVFVGDRSRHRSLWSVDLREGRAVSEPKLLQDGFLDQPLAVSSSGELFYRSDVTQNDQQFIAIRTPEGGRVTQTFFGRSGRWSPDGTQVAFQRVGVRDNDLVVRRTDDGEERLYPQEAIAANSQRWLPSGDALLVFVMRRGFEDIPGGAILHVDRNSGRFTFRYRKNDGPTIRSVVMQLSPDGRTAYHAIRRDDTTAPWVGIVAVNSSSGKELRRIMFPAPGFARATNSPGLALSPDATRLAILGWTDPANDKAVLVTIGVDGSGYRLLHGPFPVDETAELVRWTPDGRTIVFAVTDAAGRWQLMQLDAAGGAPRPYGLDSNRLTSPAPIPRLRPGSLGSFDLHPDGSRVLFDAATLPLMELWAARK